MNNIFYSYYLMKKYSKEHTSITTLSSMKMKNKFQIRIINNGKDIEGQKSYFFVFICYITILFTSSSITSTIRGSSTTTYWSSSSPLIGSWDTSWAVSSTPSLSYATTTYWSSSASLIGRWTIFQSLDTT